MNNKASTAAASHAKDMSKGNSRLFFVAVVLVSMLLSLPEWFYALLVVLIGIAALDIVADFLRASAHGCRGC